MDYLMFLDDNCFKYFYTKINLNSSKKKQIKNLLSYIDVSSLVPENSFLFINELDYIRKFNSYPDVIKKSTLSVVYIVKNEEYYIEHSILSISEIADEIIIVDTGSTDNTLKILNGIKANNSKLKVFHTQWNDDFSEARNYANSLASSDWILTLDADESFNSNSEIFKKVLDFLNYFNELKNIVFNLKINRTNNTYTAVKLKKNNPDIKYIGKVHEIYAIDNGLLPFVYLDFEITSFDRVSKSKIKYYTKLLNETIKEYPDHQRWRFFYLRDNFSTLDYRNFEEIVEKSLKVNTNDKFSIENIRIGEYTSNLLTLLLYKSLMHTTLDQFQHLLNVSKHLFPSNSDFIFLEYFYYIGGIQDDYNNLLNNFLGIYNNMNKTNTLFDQKYLDGILVNLLVFNGYIDKARIIIDDLYKLDPELFIFKNPLIQYLIDKDKDVNL
ncbi:glycosyltransferase family 2 protein [Virgibacillus sp. NKC19-3]|uniref:glycosyltransferase family 2 protein n=1 Tax=Virgibacillus saliphilus TaxID=2831674 RepID=UPI001C9A7268|nr:glycosyltransferase family 2 protein [Virgibacillus sp. NKC19-3]MBY7144312.1 glycosyltransferase family 2 protein [Virgibacillus sp. NKC19-3]